MQTARNLIENLQEQIQTRMVDKNLNARELERRAGLKISAVRNILSGKSSNPGIEVISSIAKLLGCSTDELIGTAAQSSNKPEAAKPKAITVWNYDLYQSCLKEVQNYLQSNNLKAQAEQILSFVRETYVYSLAGNNNKADMRFVKWIIDSQC
ncbi:MAG: helix-turn-helix transcriptional regulator [Pseudomonadota bacterium]